VLLCAGKYWSGTSSSKMGGSFRDAMLVVLIPGPVERALSRGSEPVDGLRFRLLLREGGDEETARRSSSPALSRRRFSFLPVKTCQ
jgi:hypothetical protein